MFATLGDAFPKILTLFTFSSQDALFFLKDFVTSVAAIMESLGPDGVSDGELFWVIFFDFIDLLFCIRFIFLIVLFAYGLIFLSYINPTLWLVMFTFHL